MDAINLAYAVDDNVYRLASVSIASFLLNNKDKDIEVFILNNGLCKEAFEEFEKLKKLKDYKLTPVYVDKEQFENLPCAWLTITAWYRLKMAELLPQIDKILYLDCDTICRRDISFVWNQNFENKSIIVEQENIERLVHKYNLQSNWYFNSGVMLCNLKKWREDNITQKLFDCAYERSDIIEYPDQDVCNIVFDLDKKHFSEYSVFLTYDKDKSKKHVIVHYIGAKPFDARCINRYKKEWWKYAKQTSFNSYFREIYNSTKKELIKERIFSIKEINGRQQFCFMGIKISINNKFFKKH